MRRAAILLLAAALSACLLAGANAALAPVWKTAELELETLAGSPEAASGLQLSSRVLDGDIAVIGSGLNLDLSRDISAGGTERTLRIGSVEAFLPPEPEDTPPALASGQAEGGHKYYGEGWALSILDEDGLVLSFVYNGTAYEPGPVFEPGGLTGYSLTPEGADMGMRSYTRQYAFDGERLAVLTTRCPEVFGGPNRFFAVVCSQDGLLYAGEITLPGAGDYVWGQVYLEFV
jgi:hypothetical protein